MTNDDVQVSPQDKKFYSIEHSVLPATCLMLIPFYH